MNWLATKFLVFMLLVVVGAGQTSAQQADSPQGLDVLNQSPSTADGFTFAIVSDLNGGEREGVFAVAAAQLALLKPAFVISVGDMIDGGTTDPDVFNREFDSFDQRASVIGSPLVHVGGNHDLTHPKMRDFWRARYGPTYSHFKFRDVLFLFLDSEDYTEDRMIDIFEARAEAIRLFDEGREAEARAGAYFQMPEGVSGHIGAQQADYFRKVLAEHPDVRWTFLFMHKPAWMNEDSDSYSVIEQALSDRPYTLFNGHFHEMQYHLRNNRDHIILATTGGSQNASSEASFDHVTLVTVKGDTPSIAHLRLDGILNKTGEIPAGGAALCFEAAKCAKEDGEQ